MFETELVTVLFPLMITGDEELVIQVVGGIRLVVDSKVKLMELVVHVKTTFVVYKAINNFGGLTESEILKTVPPPLKPVPVPPPEAVP